MAEKKQPKGLIKGDKVEVVETGQKGTVRDEYYAGGDVKDPVYSVELANGETRHYTLDQLEKLDEEAGNDVELILEGE